MFYPNKILFETNENSKLDSVNNIIKLYSELGYIVKSRDFDTLLELL